MEITSAQYVNDSYTGALDTITATIDGRVCSVPIKPGVPEYDKIMELVAEGTLTIADAE